MLKRSKHPLVREVALALLFKTAALALIYVVCFGPAQRIEVTPQNMATAILGTATAR